MAAAREAMKAVAEGAPAMAKASAALLPALAGEAARARGDEGAAGRGMKAPDVGRLRAHLADWIAGAGTDDAASWRDVEAALTMFRATLEADGPASSDADADVARWINAIVSGPARWGIHHHHADADADPGAGADADVDFDDASDDPNHTNTASETEAQPPQPQPQPRASYVPPHRRQNGVTPPTTPPPTPPRPSSPAQHSAGPALQLPFETTLEALRVARVDSAAARVRSAAWLALEAIVRMRAVSASAHWHGTLLSPASADMAIAARSLHGLARSCATVPVRFRNAPQHWTALAALLLDPSTHVRRAAAVLVRSLAYGEQARRVVALGPSLSAAACERALSGAGFAANARQAAAASQRVLCACAALEADACLANLALDALGAFAELLGIGTQPGWPQGMQLSALNAGVRRLQDGGASTQESGDTTHLAAILALVSTPPIATSRSPTSTTPQSAFASAHAFLVRGDCTSLWACACIGRQFAAAQSRIAGANPVQSVPGAMRALDPLVARELVASSGAGDSALPAAIEPLLARTRAPNPLGTRAAALDALASVLACAPCALRIGSEGSRARLLASLKDTLRLSRGISATGEAPEVAAARAAVRMLTAILAIDGDAAADVEASMAEGDCTEYKRAYDTALPLLWRAALASLWVPIAVVHRAVDVREAALDALGGAVTDLRCAAGGRWADALLEVEPPAAEVAATPPVALRVLACVSRLARADASAACRAAACRATARMVAACLSARRARVDARPTAHAGAVLNVLDDGAAVDLAAAPALARAVDALACAAVGDASAMVRVAATAAAATVGDGIREAARESSIGGSYVDVGFRSDLGVRDACSPPGPLRGDPIASLAFVGLLESGAVGYASCMGALIPDMPEEEVRAGALSLPPPASKARPHAIRLLGCLLAFPTDTALPWQRTAHSSLVDAAGGASGGRGLVASKSAWNACVALRELHATFDGPFAGDLPRVARVLAAAVEHASHAKVAGHAALALAAVAGGAAKDKEWARRHAALPAAMESAAVALARRARVLDSSNHGVPEAVLPWLAHSTLSGVVAVAELLVDAAGALAAGDAGDVAWALDIAALTDGDGEEEAAVVRGTSSALASRAARHGRVCTAVGRAESARRAWLAAAAL